MNFPVSDTAAILEKRNNIMIFLREINYIFMQISFTVGFFQHDHHESQFLYKLTPLSECLISADCRVSLEGTSLQD